ncbi:ubiquitin-like modifier-activating enzyme ATG7 [Gigantopelta aegis]|uniref:ubiquitin-like modifier-activating enzyme ATG7 n=1 Tax=Gigantopelta aegis TaxID=1735272 RepID=UPI001B88E56C|nr:ubiquitin-like modifier-activating enzyme ATG7 [Gigantopelta aegis]
MDTETPLQFAPFSSALDTGFWQKLSQNKLNLYGLDEQSKPVSGFYFNGDPPGMTPRLSVDFSAFDSDPTITPRFFLAHGTLHNTNTLQKFKECDKKELLDTEGKQIWEDIQSGKVLQEPAYLARFLALTHADLKKYDYYYWFAYPCLALPDVLIVSNNTLDETFTPKQVENLVLSYDTFQSGKKSFCGYFLVTQNGEEIQIDDISKTDQLIEKSKQDELYFAFADPCTLESHPGWPLRNFLALISYKWGELFETVNILCFRDRTRDGVRDIKHSLILKLKMPKVNLTDCPKCVGWERNERGKLGPRHVNLSSSLDPAKLAESAVDLNLKLMRWRLLPDLNLDMIGKTKVLLLGAGTLGCNVARGLMAWGVRHVTMVDNAKVSYSNPVRQSLFTFEDCLNGGKPKAVAAAESLKKIFPGVESVGLSLSIPMPGHSIADKALDQTVDDVKKLEELIDNHDVVFLLMDTRESRWLPTLIGGSKKKIVLNAALGFDTFLVLRHGIKTAASESKHVILGSPIPGNQLGCYFCNDVVAPGNSTRDRTLDQQCTVTRPGVSMIAGALAVELMVSILQHPQRAEAPADTGANDQQSEDDCCLGMIPHQIRGFLSRFHHVLPASQAFDKCTACSQIVLENYERDGFQFLQRVFNEPTYLEDLTGLTQMQQETLDDEVWYLSDEETEPTTMEMS